MGKYTARVGSPRTTRSNGRETIATVKKFALAELEKHGAVGFNLDRVIDKSGVSRSSVYHHFGSRDKLIAAVSVELSHRRNMQELSLTMEAMRSASTPSEMFDVITAGLRAGATPDAKARRLRRVAGLGATGSNKALQAALNEVQLDGTDKVVEALADAQERGLIAPVAPLRGVAYFIQSVMVGRIITDMSQSDEIDGEWLETALTALRAVLGTDSLTK